MINLWGIFRAFMRNRPSHRTDRWTWWNGKSVYQEKQMWVDTFLQARITRSLERVFFGRLVMNICSFLCGFWQTPWENGLYKLTMTFPEGTRCFHFNVPLVEDGLCLDYPSKPPKCKSVPHVHLVITLLILTQANSHRHYSIPMYIHRVPFVYPF